jgi:hypothetical protein
MGEGFPVYWLSEGICMTTATVQRLSPMVEEIMAWESEPIIERYARMFGKSREESLACFVAWKQFMALSAIQGAGNSVPSGPIDEMWHTALVFTKPYRDFCSQRVGRFVDHNPQEHSNPAGYDATRRAAEELFGQLDVRFWTSEGACCGSGCCND